MDKKEKIFYTKNELADELGLNRAYLTAQLKSNPRDFPPFRRIGRKYIFLIEDIKTWFLQKSAE